MSRPGWGSSTVRLVAASSAAAGATFFARLRAVIILWGRRPFWSCAEWTRGSGSSTTATTITHFLMVALLQNSQTSTTTRVQHKLKRAADGLANLMDHLAREAPNTTSGPA